MNPSRTFRTASAGLLLIALSIFAASCGSSPDSNAGVVAAINVLDSSGLHDIDQAVNTNREIPPTAQTTAEKLETIVKLTDWPKDLKSPADKLATHFNAMAGALDSPQPDLAKVGPAVKTAHDAWHEFSHLVWEYLAKQAGTASAAHAAH